MVICLKHTIYGRKGEWLNEWMNAQAEEKKMERNMEQRIERKKTNETTNNRIYLKKIERKNEGTKKDWRRM